MIIIKYKHNDSNKTIESLRCSLSLLSLCNVEWQARVKENHLCHYSGLIVVPWSTGFRLIILHEDGFGSFTGLGRSRKNRESESKSMFAWQSCLLLMRNVWCYHPLSDRIWQERFVKPLSLSGKPDEYSSSLQFQSITLHRSRALFALMDELL